MAGPKKTHSIAFQIGARLSSSFPAAFKNAEKQVKALQAAAKNAGAAWGDFASKTGRAAMQVTALAAGIAGGTFALSKTAATAAENINRVSAATGLSRQALQQYEHAAEKAGLKTEEFDKSIQAAHGNLAKWSLDPKNDPLKKFGGLSSKRLFAKGAEQGLERVADFYRQLKDPAQKAALAAQMFGQEAGPKMQRLLEMGSEGIKKHRKEFELAKMGLSDKELDGADRFTQALEAMQKKLLDVRNKVGSSFFTSFTGLFEKVGEIIERNTPAIKAFADNMAAAIERNIPHLEAFIARITELGAKVWEAAQRAAAFVGGWENLALIAIGLKALPIAVSGVNAVVKTAIVLQKAWGVAMVLFGGAAKGVALGLKAVAVAAAANPVGAVIVGIMAVVAGFVLLYNKCEGFRNIVDKVASTVAGIFIKLWDNIKAGAESFLIGTAELFLTLPQSIQAALANVSQYFSEAFDKVKSVVSNAVNVIMDYLKPITDFFNGIGGKIDSAIGAAKGVAGKVGNFFGLGGDEGKLPGHADGGIFTKPHIAKFAERVPEAAIPVEKTARTFNLLNRTAELSGFGGSGGHAEAKGSPWAGPQVTQPIVAPVMARGGDSAPAVNPVFNLTINGNASPEAVKQLEGSFGDLVKQMRDVCRQEWNEREARQRRLSFARQ